MSETSVGEFFQDSFSSFSDLRTSQVLTFVGDTFTSLGTIFLDTIYKLIIIAGARLVANVASEKLSSVFPDLSKSGQTPFVNIEDADIRYSSPGLSSYSRHSPGEEYAGNYQYSQYSSTGTGYGDDYGEEPVYVESSKRKRKQRTGGVEGLGAGDELEHWVIL